MREKHGKDGEKEAKKILKKGGKGQWKKAGKVSGKGGKIRGKRWEKRGKNGEKRRKNRGKTGENRGERRLKISRGDNSVCDFVPFFFSRHFALGMPLESQPK